MAENEIPPPRAATEPAAASPTATGRLTALARAIPSFGTAEAPAADEQPSDGLMAGLAARWPAVFARLPRNAPTAPPAAPETRTTRALRYARTAARYALIAFCAWFAAVMLAIVLYRFVNPPMSMLMLMQRLTGQSIDQRWIPLEAMSTSLKRAVITSEDGKFCTHWGFDLGEIRAAMRAGEGFGRGASTITQQTAKNLFLWPGKSYVRKALEVPITLAIEATWPKRRILEVYLNIAEWGPGIFGAEAAAHAYFDKRASAVGEREAAQMAVALPNPIQRDPSDPDSSLSRKATTLQARMRAQGIGYCALNGSGRGQSR